VKDSTEVLWHVSNDVVVRSGSLCNGQRMVHCLRTTAR